MTYELPVCILIITLQGCYTFSEFVFYFMNDGIAYTCHYITPIILWPFVFKIYAWFI